MQRYNKNPKHQNFYRLFLQKNKSFRISLQYENLYTLLYIIYTLVSSSENAEQVDEQIDEVKIKR